MKNDPQLVKAFLKEKQQQHLYRSVKTSESPQAPIMTISGKKYLSFCSNDYLGLANHPDVIHAFKTGADKYGVGSGAAHLINGHSKAHQELEEALAEFAGRERALLFSTGYMANLGVVNALLERGDYLFQDKLNHASLIDAGRLSEAKMYRYAHNDMQALTRRYEKNVKKGGGVKKSDSITNSMILSDGVFSMDGDIAPVREMADIAQENNAWLMIDDAHGFGVLGNNGAGLLEQESLKQKEAPILMATLGKAIGTAGAFVAGSNDLIEFLIQTARTYIYTTAMPPAIATATLESLKIVKAENWRRDKLNRLTKQFKTGASELGINLLASETAIQPIVVGDAKKALEISDVLQKQGILVTAIRPPTVAEGSARLRVTFSANHEEKHVDKLLIELEKVLK